MTDSKSEDEDDRHRYLEVDGETKTITEWAKEYGITPHLIRHRLRSNWDVETAVTKPARSYRTRDSYG